MNPRIVAVAAVLLTAGCAPKPFVYKPHGPITTAAPKYSAVVALVDDQSPRDPACTNCNFAVTGESLRPKRMTEYLIEDLSNSGLFSMVSTEGEGEADVLVQPTYLKAEVTSPSAGFSFQYHLQLRVEVRRNQASLLNKVYSSRWKTGISGYYPDGAALAGLMDEIRKDIAAALKGR